MDFKLVTIIILLYLSALFIIMYFAKEVTTMSKKIDTMDGIMTDFYEQRFKERQDKFDKDLQTIIDDRNKKDDIKYIKDILTEIRRHQLQDFK